MGACPGSNNQTEYLGVNKTYNHIQHNFFCCRLKRDIATYIKTCHTSQVTGKPPSQSIKSVLIQPIPVNKNPFEHFILDCVGTLQKSNSGCQYLLICRYCNLLFKEKSSQHGINNGSLFILTSNKFMVI